MFMSMNSNDLRETAQELRRRFGARVDAAYVPGKTFFRDALCEQRGISQAEAEALCDSLEQAKLIRFVQSASVGSQWIIES
jgi:hypothetical protein